MKRFALFLSALLILLLVFGPLYALKVAFSKGKVSEEASLLHFHTGNTTRLTARDWLDMQETVMSIRYGSRQPAVVVTGTASWAPALACQSLSAAPLNLPVLLYDGTAAAKETIMNRIEALAPGGLAQFGSANVILVAEAALLEEEFRVRGYRPYTVSRPDPAENVAAVAELLDELKKEEEPNVILVDLASVEHALPAASWLAHRGDPLLLVENGSVPEATRRVLEQGGQGHNLYLLGPAGSFGGQVSGELGRWGRVVMAGEDNSFANAVAFARLYDEPGRFGWRATQATAEAARRFLLGASGGDWRMTLAGNQLFSGSLFGPLLLTHADKLPPETEKFLWSVAPDWWVTPAEGPFNHVFILGGPENISYAVQGRVDFTQEIRDYLDQGDQGISGIEALTIVWYALSLASAAMVWFHLSTRLTQVSPFMKLSWVLVMLVLGPAGLWAYYTCYRGYSHQTALGKFIRPLWVQVLSATLGTLGFGMPVMVATAFLLALFGLPLLLFGGFFFWLGSPMTQAIIWSYLAALISLTFIFVPLMLRAKEPSAYRDTIRDNALTVFLSMTFISVGMMGIMWLLQMRGLSVMPEEETLVWWGTVYAANLAGLATGYIGNWSLVVRGRKKGSM